MSDPDLDLTGRLAIAQGITKGRGRNEHFWVVAYKMGLVTPYELAQLLRSRVMRPPPPVRNDLARIDTLMQSDLWNKIPEENRAFKVQERKMLEDELEFGVSLRRDLVALLSESELAGLWAAVAELER